MGRSRARLGGKGNECCLPPASAAPLDAGVDVPAGAPAEPIPYAGTTFGCDFIQQPVVREIVLHDGREFAAKITESGAFNGNAAWEDDGDGELAIESQRGAYPVIAGGLVSTDSDKADCS